MYLSTMFKSFAVSVTIGRWFECDALIAFKFLKLLLINTENADGPTFLKILPVN